VDAHGSQCGFCTPGFIMSMYTLLRSNKQSPTEAQIEESLAGNLCRCTGYRPIVDAFRVFAKTDNYIYCNAAPTASADGSIICPSTGKPCSCGESTVKNEKPKPTSYNEIDGNMYYERELIFPPELVLRTPLPLQLNGFGGIKWYRPLSLEQVLTLKKSYPGAKLVIGNSEVGIETKFKNAQYNPLISVTHVPELNILEVREGGIEIGSSVRLATLEQILKKVVERHQVHETSSCRAILGQLKWFAGTQIRNVASVGGNICTASPISDLNPLWMASGAKFQIIDCKGNVRNVPAMEFFLGYRKVDLKQDEILLSVFLPWTRHFEFVKEFKQAHRREDDIALVNAGMRVHLKGIDGGDLIVSDVSLVYGGVAAVPLIASKAMKFLSGKSWDEKSMLEALDLLKDDVSLSDDAPGGMVEFRRSLTLSFFFKFFMWVRHEMNQQGLLKQGLSKHDLSAIEPFSRPPSSGSQSYEVSQLGTSVGLPKPHLSANLQVGNYRLSGSGQKLKRK
jgi:xanthine dehydrogenase/oxidase